MLVLQLLRVLHYLNVSLPGSGYKPPRSAGYQQSCSDMMWCDTQEKVSTNWSGGVFTGKGWLGFYINWMIPLMIRCVCFFYFPEYRHKNLFLYKPPIGLTHFPLPPCCIDRYGWNSTASLQHLWFKMAKQIYYFGGGGGICSPGHI